MADGNEKKLRWKKSEKARRIRRRELWKKEDVEIKEIEARCRDVSYDYTVTSAVKLQTKSFKKPL